MIPRSLGTPSAEGFAPTGVYQGIVKQVDLVTKAVWVEIPRLSPGVDFGPVSVSTPTLPEVDDLVSVVFFEGRPDDLVVVGIYQDFNTPNFVIPISHDSTDRPTGLRPGTIIVEPDTSKIQWWNGTSYVTANIGGNAATANRWTTPRSITLQGDATGVVTIDGSGNVLMDVVVVGTSSTVTVPWANVTSKPDPIITFAGDLTGSVTLTDLLSATATLAVVDDSHTHDGRYFTETESDARFLNLGGGTLTGALNGTSLVLSGALSAASAVIAGSLSATNLSGLLDWANITNKPDPEITLAGDLTGSVILSDLTSGTLTATLAANSVTLGTDTAGNYIATIVGTANEVEVSGSGSESAAVTIGLPDSVTITQNLVVGGNLTVNGTTATVNSTTVTIDDPIFTLGGDTAPISDDNKDRGIEFRYYSGSAKVGFFGFDDSTGKFTFIPDATNTSEVFSGTKGTIDANIEWADVLSKPDPVITLTGAVTGSGSLTDLTSGSIATTAAVIPWASITNLPDPVLTFTGDVTGSGTMTDLGSISIALTIAANSIVLGTDTTGDYVAGVIGTAAQITVTGSGGEGSTPTLSLPSAVTMPGSLQVTTTLGSTGLITATAGVTAASTTILSGTNAGWSTITSVKALYIDTTTAAAHIYLRTGSSEALRLEDTLAAFSRPVTMSTTLGVTGATTLAALAATTGAFSSTVSATRYTSTIVTGTSPLVVASTTMVANLNVQYLDGQLGSHYLDFTNFTNLPDPVITLAGDLSGSVTLTDLASGTLTATIVANSVALGGDTTGDYVAGLTGTANQVTVTGSGGEGSTPALSLPQDIHSGASPTFLKATFSQATGVAPLTVSSTTKVANLHADLFDGQEGSWYQDFANHTNLTSPVINLGGDLSGSVTLTSLGNGPFILTATIAANSVALGADTTGNYVATIAGTVNQVSVSGSGSETAVVTLSLPQDIHSGATPTFAGLTLTGALAGVSAAFSGTIASTGWASGVSGWGINSDGSADFRGLSADNMFVKVFTVEDTQALAGSQIIVKTTAVLAQDFTVPAAAGIATLWVNDLRSGPDEPVFEDGDYVVLRDISRSAGTFTDDDAVGVVSDYTDGTGADEGTQSWTWTRGTGADAGTMVASTIVLTDDIALDYGISGNGYLEATAVDGVYGANAPYYRVVTFTGAPIAVNRTVRSQLGNLKGITGIADEYGFLAGTYAATGGEFFRASNEAFELHGIDLLLWDGGTNVIKLDRSVPSFAIGSPVPTGYATGAGIWMGKDVDSEYKFRVGDPAGDQITYDAGTLEVTGTINATSGNFSGTVTVGTAANKINLVATGTDTTTNIGVGTGGYAASGQKVWVDASGRFSLGTALTFNGTTLSVAGAISGGTIDIGGADATSFHVDASGQMWMGAASYATAPFKIDATGQVKVGNASPGTTFTIDISGNTIWGDITSANWAMITNSGTIHLGGDDATSFHVSSAGNLWIGSGFADYATAPFRVSSTGDLQITSLTLLDDDFNPILFLDGGIVFEHNDPSLINSRIIYTEDGTVGSEAIVRLTGPLSVAAGATAPDLLLQTNYATPAQQVTLTAGYPESAAGTALLSLHSEPSGAGVAFLVGSSYVGLSGPATIDGTLNVTGAITLDVDLAVTEGGTGASSSSGARTNLGLVIGTNVQAYDPDLATIAGLTATTDNFIVSVASAWASRTPAQVRTTLGLVVGTNVQAWDADLDTIAGLTSAADKIAYATGAQTWALTDFTSTARSILDDTSVGAVRTTLGVGSGDSPTFAGATLTGALGGTSAVFSGAVSGTTGTFNSGVSITKDNATLATIGATGTGRSFIQMSNTGGLLVVGVESSAGNTIATNTSSYAGVISSGGARRLELATNGIVRMTVMETGEIVAAGALYAASLAPTADLDVVYGGTGASDAAGARTNLGLVIGTNIQAFDADLSTLAGLTATTDNFIVSVASAWASRTPAQVRTTLGLVIGTDVQAYDADLAALAANSTAGFIVRTAPGVIRGAAITGTTNRITVSNGDGVSTNPVIDVGTNVYTVGGTDVAVTDGGTGASSAAAAATNLGLGTTDSVTHKDLSVSTSTDGNGVAITNTTQSPGLRLLTTNANGSARNWGLFTNLNAFGDIVLRTSTAAGGNPFSAGADRFSMTNAGVATFANTVNAPAVFVNGSGGYSTAKLTVKGGTTTATPCFAVLNSSGTPTFIINDDGSINPPPFGIGGAPYSTSRISLYGSGTGASYNFTLFNSSSVLKFAVADNGDTYVAGALDAASLTLTADLPVTEGGTGASTAAAARTNLGVYNQAGFRNILHNGGFDICQRGSGPVTGITTLGFYVPDRWQLSLSALGTWTMETSTDTPVAAQARSSLKLSCTTADASPTAGDHFILGTAIEGNDLRHLMKGKSGAESVTVSFWVKSTTTGTYVVEMQDAINARDCSASYTISSANTWEYKTVTFPPDTTGVITNTNAAGIYFYWWLAAGPTYTAGTLATTWHTSTTTNRATGQTNLGAANTNNIFFCNMQAEVGTVVTPFERRPHAIELELCQRYYYRWTGTPVVGMGGWILSTTTAFALAALPTSMRTAPTLTVGNVANWRIVDASGSVFTPSAISVDTGGTARGVSATSDVDQAYIAITRASAGLTAGRPIYLGGGTSDWLALSADI